MCSSFISLLSEHKARRPIYCFKSVGLAERARKKKKSAHAQAKHPDDENGVSNRIKETSLNPSVNFLNFFFPSSALVHNTLSSYLCRVMHLCDCAVHVESSSRATRADAPKTSALEKKVRLYIKWNIFVCFFFFFF